jgi:hypothetical protein
VSITLLVLPQNEQAKAYVILLNTLAQTFNKTFPLLVVGEQPASFNPIIPDHPARHMIDRTRKLDSEMSRHGLAQSHTPLAPATPISRADRHVEAIIQRRL